MIPPLDRSIVVERADGPDLDAIHRIRHEVYARELGQHPTNASGALADAIDDHNVYIVARVGGRVAGFVSLTPPVGKPYSVDKYFDRGSMPVAFDDGLYEIRLLTVVAAHRRRELATLLMYAAYRWVESHEGTRVVAIGRAEVMAMYRRLGFEASGLVVDSGAVRYELMQASVEQLRDRMTSHRALLDRAQRKADWRLSFPFRRPPACFHGGTSFRAIGERFDALDRRHRVINADVLDAWFPPAPGVLEALREHLPWLVSTSPPTDCGGLVEAIAQARGVGRANVLPGAGSSDLIFRAFREWLTRDSTALIFDPTYGEYAHVLDRVIGCRVDRLPLRRDQGYRVDLDQLGAALALGPDLAVVVNPNSPTGRHVDRADLEAVLARAPASTTVWVDETYVEYAGPGQSLERFAASTENVVVCKSMSKVYALSGMRVAYLCAAPHRLEALRGITPPWVVGLPAQLAAVRALADPGYYADRYAETTELRNRLADRLGDLGCDVVPGVANFALALLPETAPEASVAAATCRVEGLFLRDAGEMGQTMGPRAIRVAVKDAETIDRMIPILARAMEIRGRA